jgi:hypothetical protein
VPFATWLPLLRREGCGAVTRGVLRGSDASSRRLENGHAGWVLQHYVEAMCGMASCQMAMASACRGVLRWEYFQRGVSTYTCCVDTVGRRVGKRSEILIPAIRGLAAVHIRLWQLSTAMLHLRRCAGILVVTRLEAREPFRAVFRDTCRQIVEVSTSMDGKVQGP